MFWADKIQRRTVLKLPPCSLGFLKTHINTTHPCVPWVTKRGQTVLLLYRDRLPRRKITPRLVESSMNVVGLIFVSGEPYLNEFVTRELFSHLFFLCWRCFLSMRLPSGLLYLGNWGWSSPGEENKMMLESPNLSSEEVWVPLLVLCVVLLTRGKDETRWVANFSFEPTRISELFGFCWLFSSGKPRFPSGLFQFKTSVHRSRES